MWICCRKRLLQTCPGLLTRDLFWCSVLPDKGLKCPVCLLEFEEQETVREMPCKHLFHAGCILPWLGKVTLRSIVQILFWLLGILLLNPLHVCNRRRTPVRSADLNYRPTIQNMRSLKKTRWDWSSSSNCSVCRQSFTEYFVFLSCRREENSGSTGWKTSMEPCTHDPTALWYNSLRKCRMLHSCHFRQNVT